MLCLSFISTAGIFSRLISKAASEDILFQKSILWGKLSLKSSVSCYCLLLKATQATMIREKKMFNGTRSRNRRGKDCTRQCKRKNRTYLVGQKFYIYYIEKKMYLKKSLCTFVCYVHVHWVTELKYKIYLLLSKVLKVLN